VVGRGLRVGATSAGLFALAFLVRAIPTPRVFAGERVHLFGNDAHYHLRRVLYSVENFPASLDVDRFINFPHGGEPIWTPVFDWLLALIALPFYRGADPSTAISVETVLVWVPPLLGAATVVALYRLTRFAADEATAIASAAILALLSGHYWYSQVGFVDHHAAVALLSTLLLASSCRLLAALEETKTRADADAEATKWAIATGVALAAIVLVWPGGLLHVAIVEGFLLLAGPARARQTDARRFARAVALSNGVALLCVAPLALSSTWSGWSEFSPAVLSRFQPWLFATLALQALLCALVWRGSWGTSVRARALESAGIGLAILLLCLSFFPALLEGGLDALRWLFKDEAFQALVGESRPLFAPNQGAGPGIGFDTLVAEARLSRFVYAVPLAAAAMVWSARVGPRRSATRLIVLQLLVLGGVTLLQRRFFNSFSVVLALAMGWSLVALYRRATLDTAGWRRASTLFAGALATAWMLLPVFDSYRWPLRNVKEAFFGETLTLPTSLMRSRQIGRTARWMRENTPPVAGFLDGSRQPEYGVIALWTHGHIIEYLARRPTVANNFGDDLSEANFLASYRFFQAPRSEALDLAHQLGVRYALVRTLGDARPPELTADALLRELSAPAEELPESGPFRLVYDEAVAAASDGSRLRIFEIASAPAR
jgi:asparagine N-glycosylation enzyme membrane subunit Stt3